jgi:hypothetical protein
MLLREQQLLDRAEGEVPEKQDAFRTLQVVINVGE